MARLDGGSSVAGYTILHSGLPNAYLGGNLTVSGNVGIGTGLPAVKLHVYGNADTRIRIDSGTSTASAVLELTANNGLTNYVFTDSGGLLRLYTGASSRAIALQDTNGGNVGIGMTSPTYPLQVHRAGDVWHASIGDAGAGVLRIGGNTNVGAVVQSWNQSTGVVRDLYLQRDGGNIGIAISSPEQKMHINAGQLLISYNTAAISNPSYGDGHIQLRTNDGSNPRIGFHRSGYTGVALYHGGTPDVLKIRRSDGLYSNSTDPVLMTSARLTLAQVNDATNLPSGTYTNDGNGIPKPDGTVFIGDWWHIINSRHYDGNGYASQIAIPFYNNTANSPMWRSSSAGTWGAWQTLGGGGVKNVQRGSTVIPANTGQNTVINVTISSVNMSKSYVNFPNFFILGGYNTGGSANLSSATNLQIIGYNSTGVAFTVYWEVVES